jgi:hypothetical protein
VPAQKVALRPDGGNPSFGQDLKRVLRLSPVTVDTDSVPEEAWTAEDVNALLSGVWDVKMLLVELLQLLGDDEEEAPE